MENQNVSSWKVMNCIVCNIDSKVKPTKVALRNDKLFKVDNTSKKSNKRNIISHLCYESYCFLQKGKTQYNSHN